jgi:uncharacterized protein with HEPN domain
MREYKLYLADIVAAMESIERFVEGMTFEEFQQDDKTASAVIRKFEIIGEARVTSLRRSKENIPIFPGKRCPACGTG